MRGEEYFPTRSWLLSDDRLQAHYRDETRKWDSLRRVSRLHSGPVSSGQLCLYVYACKLQLTCIVCVYVCYSICIRFVVFVV